MESGKMSQEGKKGDKNWDWKKKKKKGTTDRIQQIAEIVWVCFFISARQQIFNRLVLERGCPHLHTHFYTLTYLQSHDSYRQLNILRIPVQQNNLQPCVLMWNLCLHGFTLRFTVKPVCLSSEGISKTVICTDEDTNQTAHSQPLLESFTDINGILDCYGTFIFTNTCLKQNH